MAEPTLVATGYNAWAERFAFTEVIGADYNKLGRMKLEPIQAEKAVKKTIKAAWPWLTVAVVIVTLCFAWLMLPLEQWMERFSDWVNHLGSFGFAIFVFAYLVGIMLLVPSAPLSLAAGVAYGWWAIPLVLVVETIGAILSFLISRYILRDTIRELTEDRPTARATVRAVSEGGWKTILLLRLSPVVPFNAQNYLLGATDVTLATFAVATTAGIFPGTVVAVYLGTLGTARQDGTSSVQWALLSLGLVATVVLAVFITVKARAQLSKKEK